MIKSVEVKKFLDGATVRFKIDRDLGVITGPNGSGKTQLLNALWLVMTGRINDLVVEGVVEDQFEYLCVEHEAWTLTLSLEGAMSLATPLKTGKLSLLTEKGLFLNFCWENADTSQELYEKAQDVGNEIASLSGKGLFFPTFRRIDDAILTSAAARKTNSGNIAQALRRRRLAQKAPFSLATWGQRESVANIFHRTGLKQDENMLAQHEMEFARALSEYGAALSTASQTLVAVTSTQDVQDLLVTARYEARKQIQDIQEREAKESLEDVRHWLGANKPQEQAAGVLAQVGERIERSRQAIEQIERRTAHRDGIILSFLNRKGLSFGKPGEPGYLAIGSERQAVPVERLSAGEKQALGLIAYSLLYENTVIIIDEPELNLHISWQRRLFPLLLEEATKNQFIIATHSPSIYSQYPDKELRLREDVE